MFGISRKVQSPKSTTPVTVAGTLITLSDHIENLDVTIGTYWHSISTREASVRPRTFTYKVFNKYEGRRLVDCKYRGLCRLRTGLLHCASNRCLGPTWTSHNVSRTAFVWVVTGSCCRGHIKPVLRDRISFDITKHIHKVRTSHQPSYLADDISDYRPARTLRSSSMTLIEEPLIRTSKQIVDA